MREILNYEKHYLAAGILRYGLYSFLIMTAYMLILSLIGLGAYHWLYIVNILILGALIYKGDQQIVKWGAPNFVTVFLYGMLVAHVAAILYAIFVMFYFGLINTALYHTLQEVTPFGPMVPIYGVGIVVYMTSAAGGTFMAYVLTLFFLKDTEHNTL